MIDRDIETWSYAELALAHLAPPYYGNGRIERWCEGMRPLQVDELRKPEIRPTIAGESARLHGTFHPSEALSEHHPNNQPSLWKQLQEWCNQSFTATYPNIPNQTAQLHSLHLKSTPTGLEMDQRHCPTRFDIGVLSQRFTGSQCLVQRHIGSNPID